MNDETAYLLCLLIGWGLLFIGFSFTINFEYRQFWEDVNSID